MESRETRLFRILLVGSPTQREPYRMSRVFEKSGFEMSDEDSSVDEALNKLSSSDFDAVYTCNGLSREEARLLEEGLNNRFPMLEIPVVSGEDTLAERLEALKYELILNKKKSKGKTSPDDKQKRAVLRGLLKNEFIDHEELSLAAQEIEFHQESENCILVLKFAPQYKDTINFDRYDDDLVDRAIRSALEELYPADASNISFVSITMNNGFIVLAPCGQSDYLIDALGSVGDAMALHYRIGIGNQFESVEYLAISYRQALDAVMQCKPDQKINNFGSVSEPMDEEAEQLSRINTLIIEAMESGRYMEIPEIVRKFFLELDTSDPDTTLNICIHSIHDILEYFGIQKVAQFKVRFRFDMLGFSGAELHNAIKAIFLDNLLRIGDIMKNIKGNPAEYIIKRAQEIVLAEYSNPNLSLSSIAQMLNISYGYLSKIFRYQTGSNFINYVTSVRMVNAKRLLLDGSMRIYEVAGAVGYSSSGYFITAFKKYYHISPSDYREKIK